MRGDAGGVSGGNHNNVQRSPRLWGSATLAKTTAEAAAKPLQLSWRLLGVEEAEIKASVATLMFPPMERRSTRLQRALRLRGSGGSRQPVRQIQETPFSVSEGMLADFQSLPVRAGPVGSYQVKSQTVSTAPNQTKALRF